MWIFGHLAEKSWPKNHRMGQPKYRDTLTDPQLERDMLRLHLDGLVVLGGLPELRICDDPEHVQRVDDVLGRASTPSC